MQLVVEWDNDPNYSRGCIASHWRVQFYKAATSSWSNYRATQRGRSRRDFVSKLGIVVEESDEALGWLEFMRDGEIASDPHLLDEAGQLTTIFTAALTTARSNDRSGKGGRSPR